MQKTLMPRCDGQRVPAGFAQDPRSKGSINPEGASSMESRAGRRNRPQAQKPEPTLSRELIPDIKCSGTQNSHSAADSGKLANANGGKEFQTR
jgi:hypothetical protein